MNDIIRHVPLNEYLNEKSNWPKRLLGWEEFHLERKAEVALEEYNRDRYGVLRQYQGLSAEEIKVKEFESLGMKLDEPHFYSIGDEVFVSPLRLARQLWYAVILDSIKRFAKGSVCELGCGYGYNLGLLKSAGFKGSYGGDFSANAVELGKGLGFEINHFDYYQASAYEMIKPESTIVTVHSLEQLPSAACFLQNLSKIKEKVRTVIHIEPSFFPERSTLMGMVRNRYNELIDHNHDLITLLRGNEEVEILHFAADVFGLHPLNSSNIIVWRFKV